MTKRASYWLIWIWSFSLLLVFGGIVYLQATHQITRQERIAARMLNIVRWQKEDVDRSIALYELEVAAKAAEAAYKVGDSDSLSRLEKKIATIEAKVRAVPRAKYVSPEAVGETIGELKALPGDVLEKFGSSSQTSKPPDYKIYEPGTYTFNLKAGEKTDHWIMFPSRGVVINYSVSSPDYQYKLVYDDGEVIQDGKDVVYPNKITDKFKILAITDQPEIKMTVVQGQLSAVAQQ
ncbi:MAG: hypothetical protein PHR36_01360 [Patescibacteria group bacterium]|nr:hypothetical protein [Patescibacteria group bacterium]